VLRDTSTDPTVHQFFNRIMSKEAAWVIIPTPITSVLVYLYWEP
jgi:hypothetical protein